MKILVVCQYYAPEPFVISNICEELVKRGHDVDVITGIPNYPMGEIYDGYKNGEHRDEVINGIKVHRCFTVGRKSGALYRFLNYFSFAFSSTRYVSKLKKDYDVVFVNQLSPVMMACAGIKYKKKHKKKLVMYCLDLWPESLVAGGIARGSLIYRIFEKISARLYNDTDRILVTSKEFASYFDEKFGIKGEKIGYLPQYAEEIFKPQPFVKKDTFDVTFAGNIGAMQSVDTIIRAAEKLKNDKDIKIHIVGDGSEYENCKKLSEALGTDNVIFYGRKPIEEMPAFYEKSDAMLVTLSKDPLISLTLPGKVQSYMAAGKAIIGAIDGEAAAIIKEADCGECVPAEDADALAECIRSIKNGDIERYAANSRKYYDGNFTKDRFIGTLIAEFEKYTSAK